MNYSRRQFLQAGSSVALLATVGCDRLPQVVQQLYPQRPDRTGPFAPPAAESIDLISHALNRFTFGARPGDYARVKQLGADENAAFKAFLDEQLQPEKIDDRYNESRVRRFETLAEPIGELFEYQERLLLKEITHSTLVRAVLSERQLFEVMVQFWSDHFNIDPSKGDCHWLKTADDREVIRKHALGRFPELLRASALSPAMLVYLDGRANRKASAREKPNENYGRELLELHTLGVHGGYTQRDVMEVARCLTGWTVRGTGGSKMGIGTVEFKPYLHDPDVKEVLGQRIPAIPPRANQEEQQRLGEQEFDRVLEIVALHPSTAKHIATKLCRRFIADDPPAAAVDRVAEVFSQSRGDIPQMLRALFATPEFLAQRGNKFKRPFNFIASALRATNADIDPSADERLVDYLRRMGHAPFHYPTPDGYPEEASPWLGTLLWRWNFVVALSEGKIKGTSIDLAALKQTFNGEAGLMAHLLGRQPAPDEMQSYHASGAGLALALASPAFQTC
jgi:uncharacterized protein (DUF1800 family)